MLLLASRSPQRRAILSQLGVAFEVAEPDYDEAPIAGLDPTELATAHAIGKAGSVARPAAATWPDRLVLGVDTVVVLDGTAHGKPADRDAARRMLTALAGRDHTVVSGLCLIRAGDGERVASAHATTVRFAPFDAGRLDRYLASGEWRGRAGGYAIQGRGAALVDAIDGDFWNVVGLPVPGLRDALAALGGPPL